VAKHRPRFSLSKSSVHRRTRPTLTTLHTEYDAHTARVEQLKREIEIQVKRIATSEATISHLRTIKVR